MERGHIGYLDSFRAFAIIGVVLTHAVWLSNDIPVWLDNVSHFGSKGVQLFFMVSGLTLALNYNAESLNVSKFFVKKFFRIAPMYYFSALFYVVVGYSILPSALPTNLSLESWLSTFTFTNGWSPKTINSFVPGGWSIAAEMMFYLCFPIIVNLRDRRWLSVGSVVISFLVSVAIYKLIINKIPGNADDVSSFAYFFWITQLPAFLIGVAIAAWLPFLSRYRAVASYLFPLVAALTIAAAFSRGVFSSYIAADVLFSGLILSAAIADFSFMRSRILTYIGTISFSIYLTHFFVIHFLMTKVGVFERSISGTVLVIGGYLITMAVAAAISSFTYPMIEKNGKNLGNALLRYGRKQIQGRAV